jgi:hypothetical protein
MLRFDTSDNPRLRRIGASVEIDPFFVGRRLSENVGDCSVGVVDCDVLPPVLREYIICGAVGVVYGWKEMESDWDPLRG